LRGDTSTSASTPFRAALERYGEALPADGGKILVAPYPMQARLFGE
jgi:hypothetical protein